MNLPGLANLKSLLQRLIPHSGDFSLQTISPRQKSRGVVALSYLAWPLKEGWNSPRARGHTNAFEVTCMADEWAKAGFHVIVADYRDPRFTPPQNTKIAIDLHGNFERWELSKDCVKVHHATGCHWLIQNIAELQRLERLKERKECCLMPRRQVPFCKNAELADIITVLGNNYTIESYNFSGKLVERIPISSAYQFPFSSNKDYEKSKRKFLWMGSYGMVHKGLDLVLEAFSQLPDFELTVCGRPEKERDFFELYHRELCATKNIKAAGWVSLDSPTFADIVNTHCAIIYPSCSEGGGGAVIHAMQAGLIPICTRESSVDLEDFGILIPDGTVDAVVDAVVRLASLSREEIYDRSHSAWQNARRKHTRESFRKRYSEFVEKLSAKL